MVATITVEAATYREVFLTCLEKCLCPKLEAGDVVVMDNMSSHKVEGAPGAADTEGLSRFEL